MFGKVEAMTIRVVVVELLIAAMCADGGGVSYLSSNGGKSSRSFVFSFFLNVVSIQSKILLF